MEVNTKTRIIVILILFTIIGLVILYYIHKNKSTSTSVPSIPDQIKSNIANGGIFFVGPKINHEQNLVYRDLNNKYYNAGYCTDCLSACTSATVVQDIIRSDCSKGVCKPVLVSSATDIMNSYLVQAGDNIMTQVDCSVVIDTSGDPNSTYANQQAMSLINQSATGPWVDLWDFIKIHKDQIIELGAQIGMQLALSKVIGEYSIVVMLLPGLFSSNANTRYATQVQVGVFGGKALIGSINQLLIKALDKTVLTETIDVILKETGAATIKEVADEVAARIAAEVAEQMAERVAAEVLATMAEAMNPLFDIIGFIGLVGIVLDVIDPCGLNNTLTSDDVNSVKMGFDSALFSSLLQSTGQIPVEWYAEYIKEFNLMCPTSNKSSTIVGTMSRETKDYLTRPENIFGVSDDDCQTTYNKLHAKYTHDYLNGLTVNSLGQCIRPYSNDDLESMCSNILGVPVSLPSGSNIANIGMADQFQKTIHYVGLQLADQNEIVGNFLSTYWYIVVIVLLIILLISFFL